MSQVLGVFAFLLMGIGVWGLVSRRHLIRIIIGFSLLDTGVHLLLVAVGYRTDGTAPIVSDGISAAALVERAVDPIPSALVLTAIVIGLAVTALMLSFAVRMYDRNRSVYIEQNKELRW
ncbi:MAG: sodium:proton antiporter [Spirochaeta sp.]|jgi:multisubunit Na+/H+ antiporter MnhC subunit|nr:sodium:proton antiporter [Spirochaeta sp.]